MTASELRKKIEIMLKPCGNAGQESAWIVERAAVIPAAEIPIEPRQLSGPESLDAETMASRRLNGEPLQYILGDEYFGIDIKFVDNIVRMQHITRVPKSASYIKGVINLRGR